MPGEKHDRESIWHFIWRGQHYNVGSGTEMLVTLCDLLVIEHPERFAKLPDEFPVVEKQWFVRGPKGLLRPHHFEEVDIWLETNMSSKRKKQFARELLRHFGHGAEEIQFRSAKTTKP